MKYDNLKEIIEGAIKKEEEAYTLYQQAAEQATDQSVRKLFEDLSREEMKHKEKLQRLDTSGTLQKASLISSAQSRTIDFLVDKPIDSIDNIQDIFIFAMKRERFAQQFYEDAAKVVTDMEAQQLLLLLAKEEKNHLDRLETVYDEKILSDN